VRPPISDSHAEDDATEVVLYQRQGCHLCEIALETLRRQGIDPARVDVDDDPQLIAKFGDCVPVVTFGGRVRFRGRVNPVLLRRLLANTSRGTPPAGPGD
jgi:glutaredoxin